MASDFFPRFIRSISQAKSISRLNLYIEKMKVNHISFAKGIRELQNLSELEYLSVNVCDNSLRDEGMFGMSDLFPSFLKLREFQFLARK